ncbi:DUF262 domain-containing protein [Moraxella canis]|uniref:DUF262 domain-containing protein n=1 Tax=Moraxella canis TaxID=90239 RepID=UPI00066551CC|nr:DUF262 domain-containing protein [Moraxella canis]
MEKLISDWHNHKVTLNKERDNKCDYFAGSIVTVASKEHRYHSLIDGQQRYTTLFLTNLINFLLLRLLIVNSINGKRCGDLVKFNQEMQKSIKFLFNQDSDIYKNISSTITFLKSLEDEDEIKAFLEGSESENEIKTNCKETGIKKIYNLLMLPIYSGDDSKYKSEYSNILKENLNSQCFNLSYDRESFNESLYKFIQQCYVHFSDGSELVIVSLDETLNKNEMIYANAAESILNNFKKFNPVEAKDDNMYKYVRRLQMLISDFLESVTVCVIQTTNVDDAYTLFEVMNDRALALDDLDLIKNQFFKSYVNKAVEDNNKVDEVIQTLDKQWVDSIFHHESMNERYKKLVAYYTTVYITGNTDLKNGDNFRTALANYLDKKDSYPEEEIKRDFYIFQVVFEILTKLKLPYQKREAKSLAVENNTNSSHFKKAIFFLNAMKQEGVISGLINLTLSSIESFNPKFDIELSKVFIQSLINTSNLSDGNINENYKELKNSSSNVIRLHLNIQSQADLLWKASLLSRDASRPREIAVKIIKDNHLEPTSHNKLNFHEFDINKDKADFKEWLEYWQYGKDNRFKIKTLLLRLWSTSKDDNGQLTKKSLSINLNDMDAETIELDHIIALKSNDLERIFSKSGLSTDEQLIHINGLGNMFILTKKANIKKSNKNVSNDGLLSYVELGIDDHFTYKDVVNLKEELDAPNSDASKHFKDRKDNLINQFLQLLDLP